MNTECISTPEESRWSTFIDISPSLLKEARLFEHSHSHPVVSCDFEHTPHT